MTLTRLLPYNYTHLIKVNDDTFINVDKLLDLNLNNIDYCGKKVNTNYHPYIHYYKCKDPAFHKPKLRTTHNYIEGGFLILSKKAVNIITSYSEDFFTNFPDAYRGEDVVVGEILHKNNILLTDICNKKSSTLNMDITGDGISFHPVYFSLMPKLFELSFSEQIELLQRNPYLNDYNKKKIFDQARKTCKF